MPSVGDVIKGGTVSGGSTDVDHTTVTITGAEGVQGGGDISASRTLSLDVDGLTADASPVGSTDYVATYDASAAGHKKVLLNNLGFADASHTHTASEITDFDTEVANNSAVTANTAKVSNATHTGDVTGDTALTIAAGAVTTAKLATDAVTTAKIADGNVTLALMADMATDSFIGRDTAGTGSPEVLSAATARSILNVEDGATADQTAGEIEAIVTHDNLLGVDANEHVDHSAVSITAGTGLSGGGTIAATRTIDLNINGLSVDLSPSPTVDYMVIYDSGGGTHKKVIVDDISPDHSLISIVGGEGLSGGGTIDATRAIDMDVGGLTTLLSPDEDNDYFVVYDVSAGDHKKVQLKAVGGVTSDTYPPAIYAYRSTDETGAAVNATWSGVTWNATRSEGTNPPTNSSGTITINEAGTYLISACVMVNAVPDTDFVRTRIKANGTVVRNGAKSYNSSGGSTTIQSVVPATTYICTTSTTFTVEVYQASGSNLDVEGGVDDSYFSVVRLTP